MKEFSAQIGYDHYETELALTKDLNQIERLMQALPDNSFAVIGGAAAIAHLGRSVRQVSPDIDLLVMPDALLKLAQSKQFPLIKNMLGVSVQTDALGIDLISAKSKLERHAIQHAEELQLGELKVPVISLAHLLAMKTLTMRDKDNDDVNLILQTAMKKGPNYYSNVTTKTKAILKGNSDAYQDFVGHMTMAKLMANL